MAAVLFTITHLMASASLHCSVRPDITPCSCAPHYSFPNIIQVTCDGSSSFNQIVNVLQDKFTPEYNLWLKITRSDLMDMNSRTFAEMNMNIKHLRLSFNNLRELPGSSFQNMNSVMMLGLSDNSFEEIPTEVFVHMENMATLDLSRGKIKKIKKGDFSNMPNVAHLLLSNNHIATIEDDFPSKLQSLHIGHNNITDLNGSVRNLNKLKLIFINDNNITDLEGEIPTSGSLTTILAHNNKIKRMPSDFKSLSNLENVYITNNAIKSFDGIFSHAKALALVFAADNEIEYLAEDEFMEAFSMQDLNLSYNQITSLNKSLLPMKKLRVAKFRYNLLKEFSLQEIAGLKYLEWLDLSNNQIDVLNGRIDNLVETETGSKLRELNLNHNLLKTLDGSLAGLTKLKRLDLSNNLLTSVQADDFDRMEELEQMDLSNNLLTTLEGFTKAFLPSLELLNASSNLVTKLEKDFHGLPILCEADLSNNKIATMSVDLVLNTRCSNHGVDVGKLKIKLHENPILCDAILPQLMAEMEKMETRLEGLAHCIVQQVPGGTVPMFMQPPIPILLNPQLVLGNNQLMLQSASIVQIIMPPNSIQTNIMESKPSAEHDQHILTTNAPNDNYTNSDPPAVTSSSTTTGLPPKVIVVAPEINTDVGAPIAAIIQLNDSSNIIQKEDSEDDDPTFFEELLPQDHELEAITIDLDDHKQEHSEYAKDNFKYTESFETEFELKDHYPEHESEMKNNIHENFSQTPEVMPIGNPLSFSSDQIEVEEPPEFLDPQTIIE